MAPGSLNSAALKASACIALEKLKECPANVELLKDFLDKTCFFILEANVRCFFHEHVELSTDNLFLWSLEETDENVASVKKLLGQCLSNCWECIIRYYEAKKAFYNHWLQIYTAPVLDPFLEQLYQWDIERQANRLSSFAAEIQCVTECPSGSTVELQKSLDEIRNKAICVLFEVLAHPETLQDQDVDSVFRYVCLSLQRKKLLRMDNQVFPGIMVIAAHAEDDMRTWAQRVIGKSALRLSVDDIRELEQPIKQMLSHLTGNAWIDRRRYNFTTNQHELWKSFLSIFKMFGPETSDALLPIEEECGICLEELVAHALSTADRETFPSLLECFGHLIERRKTGWIAEQRTNLTRRKIFADITMSAPFESYTHSTNPPRAFVSWISPYLSHAAGPDEGWTDSMTLRLLEESLRWTEEAKNMLEDAVIGGIASRWRTTASANAELIANMLLRRAEGHTPSNDSMSSIAESLLKEDMQHVWTRLSEECDKKCLPDSIVVRQQLWAIVPKMGPEGRSVRSVILRNYKDLAVIDALKSAPREDRTAPCIDCIRLMVDAVAASLEWKWRHESVVEHAEWLADMGPKLVYLLGSADSRISGAAEGVLEAGIGAAKKSFALIVRRRPSAYFDALWVLMANFMRCHAANSTILHSIPPILKILSSLIDLVAQGEIETNDCLFSNGFEMLWTVFGSTYDWVKRYSVPANLDIRVVVLEALKICRRLVVRHIRIRRKDDENLFSFYGCLGALLTSWVKANDEMLRKECMLAVMEMLQTSLKWRSSAGFPEQIKLHLEKIASGKTMRRVFDDEQRMALASWISEFEHMHAVDRTDVVEGSRLNDGPQGMTFGGEKTVESESVDLTMDDSNGGDHDVEIVDIKPHIPNGVCAQPETSVTLRPKTEILGTESSSRRSNNVKKRPPSTGTLKQPSINRYVKPEQIDWHKLAQAALRDHDTAATKPSGSSSSTKFSVKIPSKATGRGRGSKLFDQLRREAKEEVERRISTFAQTSARPVTDAQLGKMPNMRESPAPPERKHRPVQIIDDPRMKKSDKPSKVNDPGLRDAVAVVRNINDLYRLVLHWDINMDGDRPPNFNWNLENIPDTYKNPQHYADTFEAFLVLECWQQLLKSKEEASRDSPLTMTIESLGSVDDFHDITFSHTVKDVRPNDHDVLQLTGSQKTFLAIIQSVRIKADLATVTCRIHIGTRYDIIPTLKTGSEWVAVRTFSLITVVREYMSIINLSSFPLFREILRPTSLYKVEPDQHSVVATMKKHGVNQPQAEAIVKAVNQQFGFTLIQGPPGTGKTKTILALVSSFLTGRQGVAIPVPGEARPATVKKNRIICCAPSNAAVDEIARRLKSGINDGKGSQFIPRLVRIGMSDSIHPAVRDITLEALVEKSILDAPAYKKYLKDASEFEERQSALRKRMAALKDERESFRALESNPEIDPQKVKELSLKINAVTKEMNEVHARLNSDKDGKGTAASREKARRAVKLQILADADVVLSTLSGAGHDILGEINNLDFPTVIIDEACQSVELSTLIPLKYGAKKCIMVGDPNQLPPTVISQLAKEYAYERSLFQRIMNQQPSMINLLSIQYRMNPLISRFPSCHFYQGKLQDAPELSETCAAPWHAHPLFPPYHVYDVHEGKQASGSGLSLYNLEESRLCVELVVKLCALHPNIQFAGRIGVITFYKQQVRKIKDEFIRRFGIAVLEWIDVGTVDGFQGQEKDIIILSCVRASSGSSVGFIRDVRRMNVALTRSKNSLFILGNAESLKNDPSWKALLDDAHDRRVISELNMAQLRKYPTSSEVPRNIFGQAQPKPVATTKRSLDKRTENANMRKRRRTDHDAD